MAGKVAIWGKKGGRDTKDGLAEDERARFAVRLGKAGAEHHGWVDGGHGVWLASGQLPHRLFALALGKGVRILFDRVPWWRWARANDGVLHTTIPRKTRQQHLI